MIQVEWPEDPGYRALGRLVLGGVAARADVPVDRVDELGLALDTLTHTRATEGQLRLTIEVTDDRIDATLGTFETDPLATPGVRGVVASLVGSVASARTSTGYDVSLSLATGVEGTT